MIVLDAVKNQLVFDDGHVVPVKACFGIHGEPCYSLDECASFYAYDPVAKKYYTGSTDIADLATRH